MIFKFETTCLSRRMWCSRVFIKELKSFYRPSPFNTQALQNLFKSLNFVYETYSLSTTFLFPMTTTVYYLSTLPGKVVNQSCMQFFFMVKFFRKASETNPKIQKSLQKVIHHHKLKMQALLTNPMHKTIKPYICKADILFSDTFPNIKLFLQIKSGI